MPDTKNDSSSQPKELRSVHTSNLPSLFEHLKISLVVSTYQAGKVILVRRGGKTINTHFRNFSKSMGISADANRLTVGGANTVWYYRNVSAVASKLKPKGSHDICYLPCLDYEVNFTKTGRYYVSVHGLTNSCGDNSIFVGLNGNDGSRINTPIDPFNYQWAQSRVFKIKKSGIYTVSVWMREGGISSISWFSQQILTTQQQIWSRMRATIIKIG